MALANLLQIISMVGIIQHGWSTLRSSKQLIKILARQESLLENLIRWLKIHHLWPQWASKILRNRPFFLRNKGTALKLLKSNTKVRSQHSFKHRCKLHRCHSILMSNRRCTNQTLMLICQTRWSEILPLLRITEIYPFRRQ